MARMILRDRGEVDSVVPKMDGLKGATMKLLFGPDDHVPDFFMREFEVEPGGHTPKHQHDYHHEVYVLSGAGEVECAGEVQKLAAGKAVYIPANELHQFRSSSSEPLRFICMVPART